MARAGKTRVSNKGANRRAAIIEAARQILIDDGYDALVVRSLADSLGITLGNLQYYFKTREVLVEAVVREEALSDLADLSRYCSQEVSDRVRFDQLVEHIVRKWRGDSGRVLGIMSFLALHNERFRQMYKEIYQQFYDELASQVRCLQPDLTQKESIERARMITALLDGASVQVQRGGSGTFIRDIADVAWSIATRRREENAPT